MVDQKKKDCSDGSCADKSRNDKLVKSTDLPLVGNPYPPKDAIEDAAPGFLETKVRSLRNTLQPFFSPLHSAYESTSDFVSIGVAHSQNAMSRLAENQSSVLNALVISGTGLLGVALARRRGIFKKILFGSVFFTGALVACYPKDAEEKAQLLFYIAKNKLPDAFSQQYAKFVKTSNSQSKVEAENPTDKKDT